MLNRFFICALALLSASISRAQLNISHEIGITSGPVAFQSDYGERHNLETNTGNTGFSIGFLHYLNFSSHSNSETFFSEHVKIRSELSFSSTSFNHFGQWVEGNLSTGKEQLRAMHGSSKLFNLGIQGEFHPIKIHDFENSIGTFGPYASLGIAYSLYTADANSTLGPLGTSITTFPKYLTPSDGRPHGFSSESKTVFSITGGLGTRYKLTTMSDLLVDLRFQYFNSDWVDGLNPNKEIYKENKSNDWTVWFNIGYILYLEY
ncbi:MAG: THC0290_0291 family protein [Flavobacterium sp.]